MPDDVTLGEVARRIDGINERLDRNDATQQQQIQLYVLKDTWNRAEVARDKEVAGLVKGIADLWTARSEDSRSRRSNQIIVALALVGSFVNILIAIIGYLKR